MINKIPVLMYHALEDEENPCGSNDPGELIYVVKSQIFRRQMEYLYKNGFQAITSLDLIANKLLPEKPVIIGFDDGHESNYTLAMPILKEFGFVAEVYVTTDWIDTPYYLTGKQISELHKAGVLIGSHGASHRYLSDLSQIENMNELYRSKSILEKLTSDRVEVFAAPGGRYNDITIECLKRLGYRIGYTSEIGFYDETVDLLRVPRLTIKSKMGLEEFKKIINKDPVYYYKKLFVTNGLTAAKKILGNHLYTTIRAWLVR